jgi:transcriptional regulator with XRE-family HTH domain
MKSMSVPNSEMVGGSMTLGERIKRLRMERGWSQTQLARRLEVHPKQVSGWERSAHVPSTDVLIRIAEVLGVSLDYLAFENRAANRHVDIADLELLQKLQEIDKLSEEDRETVKAVLDTFILKSRFQRLAVATE